jgi:regulator of replication initiation timing
LENTLCLLILSCNLFIMDSISGLIRILEGKLNQLVFLNGELKKKNKALLKENGHLKLEISDLRMKVENFDEIQQNSARNESDSFPDKLEIVEEVRRIMFEVDQLIAIIK